LELFRQRHIIIELVRRDFRSRYLGSHLGIIWAFLHPLTYLFILWFVFEVAFNVKSSGNYPYVLWLMAGLFPWFFFSEALTGATASIIDHSFLVKKIIFPLGMLPIVKILSTLTIHLFLVAVMLFLFLINGYSPTLHWLQLPYYLLATICLVLGISWTTAAIAVYFRDVIQLVAMCIQFLFWFTPIVWSPDLLPSQLRPVVALNPVYYLVQGYRESFLAGAWFWEEPVRGFIFWMLTVALLSCGAIIFRRLRLNFGDVL
jgi:lipopolysaccharide transport system permease protein/teichoic acid transport system permease protein